MCKDESLSMVKNALKGDSMELDAWRRLCKEYEMEKKNFIPPRFCIESELHKAVLVHGDQYEKYEIFCCVC